VGALWKKGLPLTTTISCNINRVLHHHSGIMIVIEQLGAKTGENVNSLLVVENASVGIKNQWLPNYSWAEMMF
jgi:hypothetical protein